MNTDQSLTFGSLNNEVSSTNFLVFNPILKDNSGSYVCSANNDVGKPIEKLFSIVVHGSYTDRFLTLNFLTHLL